MTAATLDHGFTDPDLVPVGSWMPARYTRSLTGTEDFTTDGDRLLAVVAKVWRTPESEKFLADPWQVWLLRHVLEKYPDDWPVVELRGQLRFRQVVISIARQNGKSVLGALLAFYFLTMHVRGPRVVGVASVARQAQIVYDRVKYAADNSEVIARRVHATATRGAKLRDGSGVYQVLPASEDSAQGEPITGCCYDELHLGDQGLWNAIVLGQSARRNSMLAGITTAGDDDSSLLRNLYESGAAAIEYVEACLEAGDWPQGDDERFGFFCWEAADDTLTEDNVIRAAPAIACGRKSLAIAMSDARRMWRDGRDPKTGVLGRDRVIRYTLNRFVEGGVNTWAPLASWKRRAADDERPLEHSDAGTVFAFERTESWEWVSITATSRRDDGVLVTELAASLHDVDHDTLLKIAVALNNRPGVAFGVDRQTLADLGESMREHGLEVWLLTAGEMCAAAATGKAAITRGRIVHAGDSLLTLQMPHGRRRDLGDAWRISRSKSTGDVDAVLSMVVGLYVAATRTAHVNQLF